MASTTQTVSISEGKMTETTDQEALPMAPDFGRDNGSTIETDEVAPENQSPPATSNNSFKRRRIENDPFLEYSQSRRRLDELRSVRCPLKDDNGDDCKTPKADNDSFKRRSRLSTEVHYDTAVGSLLDQLYKRRREKK